MRVLHIQKAAGIGGSERHLLDLLAGQRARDIDAHLCLLVTGDAWRLVEAAKARSIPVVEIAAGRDLSPLAFGRLVAELRRFRPDLVHTHLIHADLHGQVAARVARVPALSTVHATAFPYRRQPYRAIFTAVGHLALRTIAISHHVGRFLAENRLARGDRIRVVHYGIDTDPWTARDDSRPGARAARGLGQGQVAVVVASRLVPHKGHDFLISGMAKAMAAVPHLRLLVAGDGPLREELEQQASALLGPDRVQFLGFVDDIPALFAAADIVAFPTMPDFGEGFGLVILEAMASGTPVIGTALDSVPEIVVHGRTGLLVQPGDVDGLAQALQELAADAGLRVTMGQQGRVRARQEFAVDRMVERTIEVYREII